MPWYFIMDMFLVGFAVAAVCWAWPKITRTWKITTCIAAFIIMILQIINEYVSLHIFKAWSFSLEHNKFIGWFIADTPIEEYLFWFAFAWMIPFFYIGLVSWFKKREMKFE